MHTGPAREGRNREHPRRPRQEEEGGYARTRVGDGHEELAGRRLRPEGIDEGEGEDERGGPLQAQLARAPGEGGQAGAEEGAGEHEPAPGPKLRSAGDRQGERQRPEERGEVALGAKDRQGEARVDERQAQERRSFGGEPLPLAVGEGEEGERPDGGRELVDVVEQSLADCEGKEREAARLEVEARKAQAGLNQPVGDRCPKGRQGDMSVVEGVHLYEELEERERGRIEQEGSRSPEVDGAESPHLRDPDTEVAGEGAGLLHTLRANRGVAAEEKQCRRREGGARSARRWMSARLEEVDGRALDREHVAECQREVAEGGEEEPLLARPRCEPGEQDRHRSPDGGERRPREKLAAGDGAEDCRDRPEQARQVARAFLPEEPDRERAVDRRDDEQPNPFAVSA